MSDEPSVEESVDRSGAGRAENRIGRDAVLGGAVAGIASIVGYVLWRRSREG